MVSLNLHISNKQRKIISRDILRRWFKITTKNQKSKLVRHRSLPSVPKVTRLVRHQEEWPLETKTDSWVISIKDKLETAERDNKTTSRQKLCIYRVPHYLRENDEKSYSPRIVSIGPYHHGKDHLRSMEQHKWRAVNIVLKRTKHTIEMYIDAMRKLEDKARACYEGHIDLDSNQFTEMLFVDGCFVLELFKGTIYEFTEIGYAPSDPVFAMRGLMHSIRRDMVMLENQLPLFVLDQLLELQSGTPNQNDTVARLAVKFFDPLMPTEDVLTKGEDKCGDIMGESQLHCLDAFRLSLLSHSPAPNPPRTLKEMFSTRTRVVDKRQQQLVHCVTELKEAGVRFKEGKTDRFWDIQFKKGCLHIPKLQIHDGTKSLFSNLIAFEQSHIHSSYHITSYVIFMDNLINSSEDVSILQHCGIIEHWLGSDAEVADLFNRLCKEVYFDPKNSYLSGVSDEINDYHKQKRHAWRASLTHKYFSNPWAFFSCCAAVILLVLTLCQTFYAVFAYYKPPS